MKYETLIKILFDLLNYKKVKSTDLAKKHNICKRTVFRYIDCIALAGVPVFTERGVNGGIFIMESFKLTSTFLTKTEFETILNALKSINKQIPNKAIESGIEKLNASVKNEKDSLTLTSGNLIIDAGPWGDAVGYKGKLEVAQKCIDDCLLLKISYHDREGEITTRIIEPHTIIFKQGLWYVYSFCHLRNAFRLFKIGRIEYSTPLKEHFVRKEIKESDLLFDKWYNSLECIMVTFSIDKKIVPDIEEWLGIENIKYNDDKITATAKLPNDKSLVAKILSYGTGLKVLSPDSLKSKIKEDAEKIAELYN